MKFIIINISLLFATIFLKTAFSQITGKVVNAENKQPIPGAVIRSEDEISTITDLSGNFNLKIHKDIARINISHIGFQTQTLIAKYSSKPLIIELLPEINQLSEVTITSTLFSQKYKNTAGSVNLLSGKDFGLKSSININDYINQLPGIYMASGTYNTNRLTIRGIGSRTPYSSNRIRAYLNDIPLTSGDGVTTIEDIDVNTINQIEVIKGPSSALYGSGLGGTLKLSTDKNLKDGISYGLKSSLGKYSTTKNSIYAGYRKNNIAISGTYNRAVFSGYRENSEYERNSVLFSGTIYSRKSDISITLSYIDLKAYIPSSVNDSVFKNDPKKAASNWLAVRGFEEYTRLLAGVTSSHTFNDRLTNKLTVFSGLYDGYESRPFNIADDESNNTGVREQLLYSYSNFQVIAGFEWYNEKYNWMIYETSMGNPGHLISDYKEKRQYLNLFGHTHLTIGERTNLEGGIGINLLKYTLTNNPIVGNTLQENYQYDPIFSPRFGINYALNQNINVYSSIGHGFSAPSVEETLLPEGIVNSELKPEAGWNFDLGSRGYLMDNRIVFDLTMYYIGLNNLLVTKRISEDIFMGVNAGKTNHGGIEGLISWYVSDQVNDQSRALTVTASCTKSINYFSEFTDDGIDYSGKELPGIPSYIIYLKSYIKFFKHYNIIIDYQLVGKQYLNDTNLKLYSGYNVLNMKAYYNKTIAGKVSIRIFGGIKNILNKRYASMILVNAPGFGGQPPRYYYPALPRNFFVGLSIFSED